MSSVNDSTIPLKQIQFTVLALQQKRTRYRHVDVLAQVNPAATFARLYVLQFCLSLVGGGEREAMLQRGERSQSHHGMNNEYRLPRPCLPLYKFKGASQVCALKGSWTHSTVLRCAVLRRLQLQGWQGRSGRNPCQPR